MSDDLDPEAYLDSVTARLEAAGHKAPTYTDDELLLAIRNIGSVRSLRYAVYYLSQGEGRSYAEIAERYGITTKQVERHMARAYYKLIRGLRAIEAHRSPVTGALPLFVRLRLRLGLVK